MQSEIYSRKKSSNQKKATEFTFPAVDEHYVIETLHDFSTEILGYTVSRYGRQLALRVHALGKKRICGITPGHSTENLIYDEYLKLKKKRGGTPFVNKAI